MALKLRDGVSMVEIDHGIALLDEDNGRYWNLNPTGALVLRKLLDGATPAQAVKELTQQYAVDRDNADQDVEALVDDLYSAGLAETVTAHRQRPQGNSAQE